MHERSEEECRVEWPEIEVDDDLWQEGSSESVVMPAIMYGLETQMPSYKTETR